VSLVFQNRGKTSDEEQAFPSAICSSTLAGNRKGKRGDRAVS
jgi:hypothetical protein